MSTTAGYAKRIGWLLFEDVTQSPFPVTGVSFTGVVMTEQGDLPVVIEHGEQEHCLELTFPALPVGRWPYAIHAQDESGEDLRLFSGYIGAVDSVAPVESSTVYDIPAMGITIPVEASKTIKAQWLSNTASIIAAQQATECQHILHQCGNGEPGSQDGNGRGSHRCRTGRRGGRLCRFRFGLQKCCRRFCDRRRRIRN